MCSIMSAIVVNHVVEPVGARPGFLAVAVGPQGDNSCAQRNLVAVCLFFWLITFFLVNHFENLNSMET